MGNDCSGDGATSITCTLGGLSEGAITIYIACADDAGNAQTASTNSSGSYTIDDPPPPPAPGVPDSQANFYNDPDPFPYNTASDIFVKFSTTTTNFDTQIEIYDSGMTDYVRRFYSAMADAPGVMSWDGGTLTMTERWDDAGTPEAAVDDTNTPASTGRVRGRG